ncbi:MAG TPA: thiamine diphosphokinase [Ignavibacteriaceae bacterium]|jgi:thiamine pyrophosphokinase|nr:thiamine diphosphokinase [Ignavibacteriaceae bacterium]HOJ17543.1 thiamine diphosphokinase [Ignavibacteriaceae bacterium]
MKNKIQVCLIIGSADIPKAKDINFFVKRKNDLVIIAADGGLKNASKLKLVPHFLIGDFDSVSPHQLKQLPSETKIVKFSGQEDTDIEKSIKYAQSKGCKEFFITGVLGKRIEHTIGNISILHKYTNKHTKIRIIGKYSLLEVINSSYKFRTHPGEKISFFSFNKETRIITNGLKYPLNDESLFFGERESISNETTGEMASLEIRSGELLLIRDLKTITANG